LTAYRKRLARYSACQQIDVALHQRVIELSYVLPINRPVRHEGYSTAFVLLHCVVSRPIEFDDRQMLEACSRYSKGQTSRPADQLYATQHSGTSRSLS